MEVGLHSVPSQCAKAFSANETASSISFTGTPVNNVDVFRTRECRCRVSVEEGRDPLHLCRRSVLRRLVLEVLAEEVEMDQREVFVSSESLTNRSDQVCSCELFGVGKVEVACQGIVVDVG